MKKIIFLFLSLFTFLGAANFLMPEEAFIPSAVLDADKVSIEIKAGEDIHIYKDSIQVTTTSDLVWIQKIHLPAAALFDAKEVYEKSVLITVDLAKTQEFDDTKNITLTLSFQGCSGKGLCYEPIEKEFSFDVSGSALKIASKQIPAPVLANETDKIADSFKNDSILIVLLTFFGFGLLLSLTPCIFPMIPILSSIIVSQGEGMSAKRGFFLSLIYVLSMAFAYTIAGVLAGLFGSNLQAAMQNPYVVISFALVFVALAFSMFGFYEIGLPSSLQSRLSKVSDGASNKGGLLGVAVMGFLSALIVGPCVAPPLAGTLVYIGQTGDAVLGGVALFVMSLGMGAPLLLIGAGSGKFMPRPGGWMNRVSEVFGVIMLAIAIWMLQKIASTQTIMALWAALFTISSIYLGALEPLGTKRGWHALLKGIGIILLSIGISVFIGLLSGAENILEPFEKFTNKSAVAENQKTRLHFKTVYSVHELDTLLEASKGKKVMLDFAAKWCTSCKELEEITFKDPAVISALDEYVLIKADLSANDDKSKALSREYNIFGPPAILFFDTNTDLIESKRVVGYKAPQEFLAIINL
ncbi:protein-disulfide reductase DsbD [bacterium]|nr:protein-disulfide reductase DsbD [bacterium]MBU1989761.1 protein-disulfide reductase DsbD [bacterium]